MKTEHEQFMHFSLDDVVGIFNDLTANKHKYSSIFDNETLRYCKEVNSDFGAVFSMYCYQQHKNYSITNVTDKFRHEFTQNSSWLRFAFHSKTNIIDFSACSPHEAQDAYNTVTEELIRITGSVKCLDKVPRLHRFIGSKEHIRAVSSTKNGIKGLLSTDNGTCGYYLSSAENEFLIKNGVFHDKDEDIFFFTGSPRLSTLTEKTKMSAADSGYKFLCFFTHEWELSSEHKNLFRFIAKEGNKKGMSFAFPMDKILDDEK